MNTTADRSTTTSGSRSSPSEKIRNNGLTPAPALSKKRTPEYQASIFLKNLTAILSGVQVRPENELLEPLQPIDPRRETVIGHIKNPVTRQLLSHHRKLAHLVATVPPQRNGADKARHVKEVNLLAQQANALFGVIGQALAAEIPNVHPKDASTQTEIRAGWFVVSVRKADGAGNLLSSLLGNIGGIGRDARGFREAGSFEEFLSSMTESTQKVGRDFPPCPHCGERHP